MSAVHRSRGDSAAYREALPWRREAAPKRRALQRGSQGWRRGRQCCSEGPDGELEGEGPRRSGSVAGRGDEPACPRHEAHRAGVFEGRAIPPRCDERTRCRLRADGICPRSRDADTVSASLPGGGRGASSADHLSELGLPGTDERVGGGVRCVDTGGRADVREDGA